MDDVITRFRSDTNCMIAVIRDGIRNLVKKRELCVGEEYLQSQQWQSWLLKLNQRFDQIMIGSQLRWQGRWYLRVSDGACVLLVSGPDHQSDSPFGEPDADWVQHLGKDTLVDGLIPKALAQV